MAHEAVTQTTKRSARAKLLEAALKMIRTQGYAATTVDDLCASAGVTKGAFFHHFKSKDDLAVAAADFWGEWTGQFFAAAPYHDHADPLDRVLGYIDFRKAILDRPLPEMTCLLGTMVQEVYGKSPVIRDACQRAIAAHAAKIETDISAAITSRGINPPWTAESLALYTQAVLQGAFILAKAKDGTAVAADCVDHLRRYVEMIFQVPQPKENAR